MLLRRPRGSRLLYCMYSCLPRRWLSVIPSLLLPHLVARGISGPSSDHAHSSFRGALHLTVELRASARAKD